MTLKQQVALRDWVICRYPGQNTEWVNLDQEWDCLVEAEMALIRRDLDDPKWTESGIITRTGRLT